MSGKVYQLQDNQALAVAPLDSVWLSASAGTGKTQVLSARVLRLLLRPDVAPDQILCLTFTKAGAAEMATRVNEVLARWVRLDEAELGRELGHIGAPVDPETRARARTLFASVLDCPGGGLRIDTIHAFAQWLLAAFPEEADLTPGTRPMEDRDRDLLAQQVLGDLLLEGDPDFVTAIEELSVRLGPEGTRAYLMRCAEAREAWFGPGSWQPPMEARTKQLLGLASDTSEASLTELVSDGAFDRAALDRCLAANRAWGTATAQKSIDAIEAWIASDAAGRIDLLGALQDKLFTQKGDIRSLKSLEKQDADYADAAASVQSLCQQVAQMRALLSLAQWLAPALAAGRTFALAWDEAKQREGFIDFDDQIRRAAELLSHSDLSDWIRYKLDRRFDHVLIDEAQDTNESQWKIIDALTDDFFSGAGQREGRQRTLFVVGDYKQAIFGFQGTSPENFRQAKERFAAIMRSSRENAEALREPVSIRDLVDLGLGRSYRTAQPVLDFVDEAIASIGPAQFGLDAAPERHRGFDRDGLVRLWKPVSAVADDTDDPEGPDWISEPERRMADSIAEQVQQWLRDGYPLLKENRNANAGDIMVLVRKRRELAGLIVARLHAAGIPVAGVDRLRLGAPLAVQDLMAALRFAAQPLDDLTLASLLVSPLMGWSQEDLLEYGYRDRGKALWRHLRDSDAPKVRETVDRLGQLLALADFEPPEALLHWVLVGPWQGRSRLIGRLGREANDPIDELLNAALTYSASHVPSLQGFIRWFDAGEGELKRDQGEGGGQVRVMTVHGSKGLQAPIVILAHATGNPDNSPVRSLVLPDPLDDTRKLPLPPLRKDDRAGRIEEYAEAQAVVEREEHWRLLYVAMTRAEEALFVGGALGKREQEPAPDSWYARLARIMPSDEIDDPVWGWRKDRGTMPPPLAGSQGAEESGAARTVPDWARTPIGPEQRPPRPLAPSGLGEERAANPPLPAEQVAIAARRGVLIHSLLERLPETPAAGREEKARAWLARQAGDLGEAVREEMLASALAVLADERFAHVFGKDSLAEVPLAAVVEGQVVAGTVDRLLVTDQTVTVVDYKTARRPPTSLEAVPEAILRQMAAYAAALVQVYPGRVIEAALLFTQTPQLIAIPAEMLERFKPAYQTGQERFGPLPVE